MRLRLTLREGRKREVRRMLWAVGHKVLRLKRISYGPIKLERLPEGKWRKLTDEELRTLARGSVPKRGAPRRKAPPKRPRQAPAKGRGQSPQRRSSSSKRAKRD
jgi:hypothetical protein